MTGDTSMSEPETLADELRRLIESYKSPDSGPIVRSEAWGLMAEWAFDNADALLSALSEKQPEDEGWREIETAPKDGTPVQLYCKKYENYRRSAVQTGHWHQPANPTVKGFWTPYRHPTHWRPLPKPPVPR